MEKDMNITTEPGRKFPKAVKRLIAVLSALALCFGIFAVGFSVGKNSLGDSALLFEELLDMMQRYHYGDPLDPDTLVAAGAHAMVDAMGDGYATYFTEEEYNSYYSSMNGNYSGIGISIYPPDDSGALIHRVFKNSFAEQAGVQKGDKVLAVDGEEVYGLSSSELGDRITGEEGTTVVLTIRRGDEVLDITVTRGNVYVERVEYFMLDGGIGYIHITSFTGDAVDEFNAAIEALTADGASSLIVDLRNNGGGYLDTVIDIADAVLGECVIASWKGKTKDPAEVFRSDADHCDLPMVLLVNGNSASASEIFAGAVQDNSRAYVIGTQTFGKGIVQTTFPLSGDNGYLKLTTDAYFTPNGTDLNGTGITPDLIVELPDELMYLDVYTLYTDYPDQDTQLQAAIAYLLGN